MALELAEMAWPEVEAELDSGNTLVVVMTASTEQHGPGLPLAVDELRADALGKRIADELGCLLAPTVRPGISAHHMAFPGTITLAPETFKDVLRDYCRSLDTHGFEEIALVTTHGGNADALEAVAAEMDDVLGAHVFVAGDREEFMDVRFDAMADHDVGSHEAGKHAGAAETSFIMESNSDLVDRESLAEGFLGDLASTNVIEEGLDTVTDNGALGDQRLATRAAGRTLIDECVNYYANRIREATDGGCE